MQGAAWQKTFAAKYLFIFLICDAQIINLISLFCRSLSAEPLGRTPYSDGFSDENQEGG